MYKRQAFVSTNSFCQGQSVTKFWSYAFRQEFKISFAHTSFYWKNLAKKNAGVIAIIVGVTKKEKSITPKLYTEETEKICDVISPYLVGFETPEIRETNRPRHSLPELIRGSIPNDDGNFIFSLSDWKSFEAECPYAKAWRRRYIGAQEISKGLVRYSIALPDDFDKFTLPDDNLERRVKAVETARLKSTKKTTRERLALVPHKYELLSSTGDRSSTVVSRTTTMNRYYLATDILPVGSMANDNSFFTEGISLNVFSLLSSRLHIIWIATVCGRMKNDYRYANTLGWNTFPVPTLTTKNKEDLTRAAENILLAREAHFPATIADLYKPKSEKHPGMPANLRAAHEENDRILEEIYIGRRFKNDTERLEKLFEMYTEMTKGKSL